MMTKPKYLHVRKYTCLNNTDLFHIIKLWKNQTMETSIWTLKMSVQLLHEYISVAQFFIWKKEKKTACLTEVQWDKFKYCDDKYSK